MTIPEKAADFCYEVAVDDSHGYDQGSRWGNPDYDCSALVIDAYKRAGVPLPRGQVARREATRPPVRHCRRFRPLS